MRIFIWTQFDFFADVSFRVRCGDPQARKRRKLGRVSIVERLLHINNHTYWYYTVYKRTNTLGNNQLPRYEKPHSSIRFCMAQNRATSMEEESACLQQPQQ